MRSRGKDFPGYGILLCGFCQEPLRDHKLGPCPKSGVAVFHTSARRNDKVWARRRR